MTDSREFARVSSFDKLVAKFIKESDKRKLQGMVSEAEGLASKATGDDKARAITSYRGSAAPVV